MADPMSIISLLGTAATLTTTVYNYASSVKDAPKEIEHLRRELTNLHDVFERLEKLVGTKESKEDLMDVSILHNAAGVGTVPFAFGIRNLMPVQSIRTRLSYSRTFEPNWPKRVQRRACERFINA